MSILIVTGTGTDVGKTITTAALVACATGTVAVVKPAQTGLAPGEPGDLAEVSRLTGCTEVFEFARYPDPLSPHHAALVSGLPALALSKVLARVTELDSRYDNVIVEGAGGLLVPYDSERGWTLVDVALELDAPLVVVTRSDLGTLNHTTLTVQTIEAADIDLAGIVIGSWPQEPGLAERCSVDDIAAMAPRREISGVLPAEMALMRDFKVGAHAALTPTFGGTFDPGSFRKAVRPQFAS